MITKEAEGALAALTQEILHVFPELAPSVVEYPWAENVVLQDACSQVRLTYITGGSIFWYVEGGVLGTKAGELPGRLTDDKVSEILEAVKQAHKITV